MRGKAGNTNSNPRFSVHPIAWIRSPFLERFGIPRQAGLVRSVPAEIIFVRTPENEARLMGISQYTHLWVLFIFHEKWVAKNTVRPPRLGGKSRLGVLATRSPHRPNPIGLSCVKLERVETGDEIVVHVSGGDFLNGTPVIDLKPYLPYCDRIAAGRAPIEGRGFARLRVVFGREALRQCTQWERTGYSGLRKQITEVIRLDPRPAIHKESVRTAYAVRLGDFDVHWKVSAGKAQIFKLVHFQPPVPGSV